MPSFPSQIGPYRIVRQLGEGGMGAVFEAIHDAIERRVAIKVMLPEFAHNVQATQRLFNEAKAVNRIAHPNIVQVSDCGQLPDGTAYLVMELLSGQTLADWQASHPGPMPVAMVVRLAAQITSALAAAHTAAIVHRDIKPDNIMLVPDAVDPCGFRVKLLDFGIAKLAHGDGGVAAKSKTATGLVMGTPYYMSPEQCQGAGYVDAQTDVYSLGVVLFEMLSGQLPFNAEGGGQLIGMHLFKEPPKLRTLAPSVPGGLADLVQGLLAKEKAERPTMAELRDEFEAMARSGSFAPRPGLLRHSTPTLPELSVPQSAPAPPGRPRLTTLGASNGQSQLDIRVSRRRRTWIAAAAALLLVLGGGGLTLYLRGARHGDESGGTASVGTGAGPSMLPAPKAAGTGAAGTGMAGTTGPGPEAGKPPATGETKTPAVVKWSLSSQPAGAAVVRVTDGVTLGITPWLSEQPPGKGEVKVVLRRPGFVDEPLTLERDVSIKILLNLRARSGARPAPTPPKPSPKPSSRKGFEYED